MSTLRQYLDELTGAGTPESLGEFSINSARGIRLFGEFSLPSAFHYLLKVVQVAHVLDASEIKVSVGMTKTLVEFTLPTQSVDTVRQALSFDSQHVTQGRDSITDMLALSLLGGVAQGNLSSSWSLVESGQESTVRLDQKYRTERSSLRVPQDEPRCRFSIHHRSTWRIWERWARRRAVDSLLSGLCAYSAIPLSLGGLPIPRYGCSALNEELREIFGSSFNAGTGVSTLGKVRVAASLVLCDLADSNEPALSLALPAQSYYEEEHPGRFLWQRYDEPDARPDGADVPAWSVALQSRGEWTRWPEGRARFRTVLGFNLHGPGSLDPLRLKVVRHGVLISDEVVTLDDSRLESLRGCSAIVCDDGSLTTDLSGFRLVEDEAYLEKALTLLDLAELGHRTFEELTPELAGL